MAVKFTLESSRWGQVDDGMVDEEAVREKEMLPDIRVMVWTIRSRIRLFQWREWPEVRCKGSWDPYRRTPTLC